MGWELSARCVHQRRRSPLTRTTPVCGSKYGFQLYDAVIAAAALEAECTTLYQRSSRAGN